MEAAEKEARIITSAQKCLQILSFMATAGEELSINEIAASLHINKSTMYHYLATMVGEGYVLQNPNTKKFRIGSEAFRVGESYLRKDLPYQDIDGVLRDFYDKMGMRIFYYIRSGEKATCVLVCGPTGKLQGYGLIGSTVPMHASAAGKVFLAYLSEHEREWIIEKVGLPSLTKKTITQREVLAQELAEIRLRGYGFDDGEWGEMVALAVPVFGFGDKIVGVVSIADEPDRLTDKLIKKAVKPLVTCGQELSAMVHNVILD
jgi:DNA-binding IclR family transcriptional regulator